MLELELPCLDPVSTKRIGEILRLLEHEIAAAGALVDAAESLRQAVVDSLVAGAELGSDDSDGLGDR